MNFHALYAGFNARDIDAVLACLHPNVRWPNGWEGGTIDGRDAVRAYWTRQWLAIDPTVTPERIEELPDGRVRVTVRQHIKDLEGRTLADDVVTHLYTVRDGLVTEMEIAP
ncbi:MAG TPA: nuclear transport factor 2 family protein [Dinghuibacter sp.]|uniref:nuclear transport factor 2 family protein n=1 Tax=Dinghuibacter sp. TaxID=2024697 RepID=UPI002B7BC610|nr:nuclear transport factor 2 family protein [Dinghuibacter sp.]HTJ11928.1 nuclear transport factor 2 family protein [Dinghuibacter sp.]